uniref:Transcription initiation factor TFIID subunit 2 n=1 Tax=Arcella intermedia TaxID=1963864 RepID=A0A6B2KW50_9EUKA
MHQKVSLDIDLHRKYLKGHVELKVEVSSPNLTLFAIDTRQCQIDQVFVNGLAAQFSLTNYLDQVVPTGQGKTNEDSYKSYYAAALKASEAGELLICSPYPINPTGPPSPHTNKTQNGQEEAAMDTNGLKAKDALPEPSAAQGSCIVLIRIDYQVLDPKGGLYFVLPNDVVPTRFAHMYSHNSTSDVKMWLPCIDKPYERHTWEMEYTVAADLTVISTGEEYLPPLISCGGAKKTYFFRERGLIPARSVLVVVGTFEVYQDIENESGINFPCYCLPGRLDDLKHTAQFVPSAYQFFNSYLSVSLPFKSFKLVFVEDAYSKIHSGAGVCVMSSSLIWKPGVIDQTFRTRKLIVLGLVQQWFGAYVGWKSWMDIWILFGFAGFLTSVYCQKTFGTNEFKYLLLSDMKYVVESPLNQPLYATNFTSPSELFTKLFYKKSYLVMYLVERRIGTDGFKRLASNAVSPPPKATDLTKHLMLSTHIFFKQIKKLTGFDMKEFADRWVYSTGCPIFLSGFSFDRAKNHTEIAIRQDLSDGRPSVSGSLSVRIVELDQEQKHRYCEHNMDIEEELHSFPCHSRPRRARPAPAPQEKNDDDEDSDGPDSVLDVATTGNDEASSSWAPIQWIRFDPHIEWLMTIHFKQPTYMWINQLRFDKDVGAQVQAINALLNFPTKETITVLQSVLTQPQMFYRVRMQAALALAVLTGSENDWLGLDHLFDFFKSNFFFNDIQQVKPNDFDNFITYYQQKMVAFAISLVRGPDGKSPPDVIRFIYHLLKNNDNSHNFWSDNYYITAVLHSISATIGLLPRTTKNFIIPSLTSSSSTNLPAPIPTIPPSPHPLSLSINPAVLPMFGVHPQFPYIFPLPQYTHTHRIVPPTQQAKSQQTQQQKPQNSNSTESLLKKIENQIFRYLNMDKLMPCYHNVITCASLSTLCHLMRMGVIEKKLEIFKEFSNYGHFEEVRLFAVKALMTLTLESEQFDGKDNKEEALEVVLHLLKMFQIEYSPRFKLKLVELWTDPRDILVQTASLWERDNLLELILTVLSLSIRKQKIDLVHSQNGTSKTDPKISVIDALNTPGYVDKVGQIFIKQRFSMFEKEGETQKKIRNIVWSMLNSEATSQDARIRLALLKFYTAIGGDKEAQHVLEKRPKCPTRPILKKEKIKLEKLKQEKQMLEEQKQEGNKKGRKRKRDDTNSAKKATTNGSVEANLVSPVGPLTLKVNLPLLNSAQAKKKTKKPKEPKEEKSEPQPKKQKKKSSSAKKKAKKPPKKTKGEEEEMESEKLEQTPTPPRRASDTVPVPMKTEETESPQSFLSSHTPVAIEAYETKPQVAEIEPSQIEEPASVLEPPAVLAPTIETPFKIRIHSATLRQSLTKQITPPPKLIQIEEQPSTPPTPSTSTTTPTFFPNLKKFRLILSVDHEDNDANYYNNHNNNNIPKNTRRSSRTNKRKKESG